MSDFDLILPIAVAIATIVGVVSTLVYSARTRKDNISDKKDKVEETRAKLQREVETTARDKLREESKTRTDLESSAKLLAADVKQNMKDHIAQLITTLNQSMELQRTVIYNKIDNLDVKIIQNKIDLAEHIKNYTSLSERMQKSLDFLQTMAWGPDAKSVPPYMFGEDESQEHKDTPEKGVFKDKEKQDENL